MSVLVSVSYAFVFFHGKPSSDRRFVTQVENGVGERILIVGFQFVKYPIPPFPGFYGLLLRLTVKVLLRIQKAWVQRRILICAGFFRASWRSLCTAVSDRAFYSNDGVEIVPTPYLTIGTTYVVSMSDKNVDNRNLFEHQEYSV